MGTVKDIQGGVIVGATVELTNAGRGLHQETKTTNGGSYRFVQVEPGDYDLTVTQTGFQQLLQHLTVNLAESTLIDVTLSVGQASQRIEVSANAAQVSLQTTNTSVGDVIQHEEVASLPTVQREITQLAYLQPGTTPMIGGPEGSSGGGTIAGGRTDQNNMTLDGIDITDKSEGGYLTPGLIASFLCRSMPFRSFAASLPILASIRIAPAEDRSRFWFAAVQTPSTAWSTTTTRTLPRTRTPGPQTTTALPVQALSRTASAAPRVVPSSRANSPSSSRTKDISSRSPLRAHKSVSLLVSAKVSSGSPMLRAPFGPIT